MDYQPKMLSVNCKYEQDGCSKLGAEFDASTMEEVDVSLEWLSAFGEECLSTKGSSLLPLPPPPQLLSTQLGNDPPTTTTTTPNSLSQPTMPSSDLPFTHFPAVPGKARRKRRRAAPYKMSIRPLVSQHLCQLNLLQNKHSLQLTSSADPLLLQQIYWLADSELSIPHKTQGGETEKMVDMDQRETTVEKSLKMQQQQGAGSGRRCSHCQAQRTPQWRSGPLGPKTLCNACGVRYKKSGRLLPEYRQPTALLL